MLPEPHPVQPTEAPVELDGGLGPGLSPDSPETSEAQNGRRGWFRSGNRTLPILAAVAVVSLGAGFALSHFVVNPADAAARTAPPAPGLVTVPIESRELSNDVTLRGDVSFDGATAVQVELGELTTRAVVTGQIPEVGAQIEAGDVILEIAGRPVIALPGGLPTFRTLRIGSHGPDVLQLKEALSSMGIPVGNVSSDVFDAATADALRTLYQRAGFPLPPVPESVAAEQSAAQERLRHAQEGVTQAQRDLDAQGAGADPVSVASADAAVTSAQRNHNAAVAARDDLLRDCEHEERVCTSAELTMAQNAVDDAYDQITVARTAREQLDVAPDTSIAQAALTAARQAVTDAQTALREANEAALPHLPASEVVFFDTLPRRIDSVAVSRGETLGGGAVMQVSGADLQVVASAAAADAALLEVGSTGFIDAGDLRVDVTVTEIQAPTEGGAGRSTIVFSPGEVTPEQVVALRGANVRITVPVGATGGDVLTVPLAALTAGPGGESRIEVHEADGSTTLVEVTTGLAAGGHVEIEGVDRTLTVGELVVIGTGTADGGSVEADDA